VVNAKFEGGCGRIQFRAFDHLLTAAATTAPSPDVQQQRSIHGSGEAQDPAEKQLKSGCSRVWGTFLEISDTQSCRHIPARHEQHETFQILFRQAPVRPTASNDMRLIMR